MPVNDAPTKAHWRDACRTLAQRTAPDWLQAFRAKAAERFEEIEYPHRKMEAWRFTNVNPISRTAFQSLIEPQDHGLTREHAAPLGYARHGWVELVFVDGFYAPGLSSNVDGLSGVTTQSLQHAAQQNSDVLRSHLGRHLNGDGQVFSALNAALTSDGAFVHVAKGRSVEPPIHVLHIATGKTPVAAVHPRSVIVLEESSEATVIESYVSLAGEAQYFNNAANEMSLGANASLKWRRVLEEGANGYHLCTTRIHQERDSRLDSAAFFLGGRIARNEVQTILAGEGASTYLRGLSMLEGDQLVDNHLTVDHAAPNCQSYMGFKSVLDGKSHSVFTGRVNVHRHAQKTDSNQLNENLLLSDKATVDTKPQLEIYADDVKCTHGATVGRPPQELVFYFQTRGMSEETARGMLTYGFADEVVQAVGPAPLREHLEQHVFSRYNPKPQPGEGKS